MSDIKKLEWQTMGVIELLEQKSKLLDLYFICENSSPQFAKLIVKDIGDIELLIDQKSAAQ